MGCGSNKEEQVLNDEQIKKNREENADIVLKHKPMKNVKIEITEDPEQQGEKYHLNQNKDNEDDEDDEEKDSFDDF